MNPELLNVEVIRLENKLYDIAGIGLGPFNLGMAALLEPVDNIEAVFLDEKDEFAWHPGMLLEGTVLNSSFLADLVTFADPTSRFTLLNYLHKHNRMFQFFFNKQLKVPRREYDSYGKWVAAQLPYCLFGQRVLEVADSSWEGASCYRITTENTGSGEKEYFYTKNVAVGTGAAPMLPPNIERQQSDDIYHAADYSFRKEELKSGDEVTVVGSGQSAAEIFHDLLQDQKHFHYKLNWFTRSPQFFQAEDAKVAREIFSTDFVEYFRSLDIKTRLETLPELDHARKGIEQPTLEKIYDLLYHRSIEREDPNVVLQAATELSDIQSVEGGYQLKLRQWQEDKTFRCFSDKVVLATGFQPSVPEWIQEYGELVEKEDADHYMIDDYYRLQFKDGRDNHIYMLTNIDHSHGTAATNLSLSVVRNQTIINNLCGFERYPVQKDTVFQRFSAKEE